MPRGKGRTGLYRGRSSSGRRTNPTDQEILMNPQSGNQLNDIATADYRDGSHNVGNEVPNPNILAPTISQASNVPEDAICSEGRHRTWLYVIIYYFICLFIIIIC